MEAKMRKKYLVPLLIVLFTLAMIIFSYVRYGSIFAETEQSQLGSESQETVIRKLDSILKNQSTILMRLDDVEREVKSRCR